LNQYSVAIVGATGMVGQEFIKLLKERNFPVSDIFLLASGRSAGKKVFIAGQEIEVRETTLESFKDVDIAFFSAGAEASRHFAPTACRGGAIVIDNSSAFRMEPNVPLVVPEVNPEDLLNHECLIANPNCSTIQMVIALYPLHKVNPIKRIVISTYQAVSGTGAAAVEELTNQSKQILDGNTTVPHVYPHQIAFNILPEIDVFMDNGYTKEEMKMVNETQKIMHAPEIEITATCVRVPVYTSHSESLAVEFSESITPKEATNILRSAPGIKILDDTSINLYPQAWSVTGTDDVYIGRIRQDISRPNSLMMWVVADNVRKGAALNAVQIAEEMIRKNLIDTERAR
jgi:aspartate-semialdehyde dehydrogenase